MLSPVAAEWSEYSGFLLCSAIWNDPGCRKIRPRSGCLLLLMFERFQAQRESGWAFSLVRAVHFKHPTGDLNCLMDNPPSRTPVTCEIDGKTYKGTYWIAGMILTVATGRGGKSRQVGSKPVDVLAQELLHQLAQEGKAQAER